MITMWRPYVVVKKSSHGGLYTRAMRDTNVYPTKEQAVRAMRAENKKWVQLNYSKKQLANTTFSFGAIKVGTVPKGAKGNSQILKKHSRK